MGSYEQKHYGFTGAFREVGTWELGAEVEMRPSVIAQERGDIEYRIVLSIEHHDETGEEGFGGELSTPWLTSPDEAAVEMKRLRGLSLEWARYDEERDDYDKLADVTEIAGLIDEAVARFKAVADPQHALATFVYRDAEGVRITVRAEGTRLMFHHAEGWPSVTVNVHDWSARGAPGLAKRIEGVLIEWRPDWKLNEDESRFVHNVLAAHAWRAI